MLVLTTAAFSQTSCPSIIKAGTQFSGPDGSGVYTLTINYNNSSSGNKTINIVVFCSGKQIFTECFDASGSGNNQKVYTGLTGFTCSNGIYALSAILTPYTGNACGGAACGFSTIVTTDPTGGPVVVLPVKITDFSAIRSKQVVSLNWNTEFEIDAKEFIVEKAEGTEFRSVGSIKSNGNSSVRKSYSFNDKNENANTTYYRLKNVDLNNSFTYSEIRTVKGIGAVNDVTVFPNPARSNSKISVLGVTANSSIQLLDFSGKVLKNMNSTTVNSLDLSGVKNGTYLIRIIDKSTNVTVNKSLTVSN